VAAEAGKQRRAGQQGGAERTGQDGSSRSGLSDRDALCTGEAANGVRAVTGGGTERRVVGVTSKVVRGRGT
jgi:hypothetical protein